jgi:hypothetical protein
MMGALALAAVSAPQAFAQAPNSGSVSFSSALDVLPGSTYVFRGIVQEADPKVTLWPTGTLNLALASGDGAVKSFGANFGVWHSLHTGSSGSDIEDQSMHYEEDFYAGVSLGFAQDTSLGITYTAYTSPNGIFGTTHELAFRFGVANMIAPYVTVAQELSGGADGGPNEGTYLEVGVGPTWELAGGKASVTVPVKLGMSLKDYYELEGEDNKFGFFDVGVAFTVPLSGIPESFGAWNFHAGVDFFALGDTNEAFNGGDSGKVTGLFGFGMSY